MKLFIFATITILFQTVWSYYFETDASNTCTAGHSDLTKARQCDCTGGIQEPCDNCFGVWGSMCYDLENPPSCAQNQVLFEPAGPQLVNAGGNCYPSITDCPWLKLNYTWTCCNCPKGTIGKHKGACDQMYSIGTFCVGCTDPKETLTGNEQIGYSCSLTCAAGASTGTNLEPCGASETSGQRGSCPVNTWCAPNLGPQDNCPGNAGCAMNNRGINLLKSFEKGCPYIYTIGGHGTIGWGHDCYENKDCDDYDKYTFASKKAFSQADGDELLSDDLDTVQTSIGKWKNSKLLNSNQLAAIIDYGYVNGAGGAAKIFRNTVKSGNLNGLCAIFGKQPATARMAARQALCNTPTTQGSGCKH